MADKADGALSGDEGKGDDKPETYSAEDVKKLVGEAAATAAKEADTKAYRRFQSDLDKATAANSNAEKEIADLKKKQIEALPEDERLKAMIEELYKRTNAPPSTPKDDDGDKPTDSTDKPSDDPQEQAQTKLKEVAKKLGLDPDKLDFNDPEKFFKGIIEQTKAGDKEEDDEKEDAVDGGSGSVGSMKDLTKVDPLELMKKGYRKPARRFLNN